jgi:lipoate-protein ligase A
VADAGDLRLSYDRINRLLVSGLAALGVGAALAAVTHRASAPGIAPCFNEPSAGEVTVDGRKLAGSAQWRRDGALLQHGSILVQDDQSLLTELTVDAVAPIPSPATLEAILGRAPTPHDLAAALASAVRELEDPGVEPLQIDDAIRTCASALVVRYLDDAWTWRR